ncbi:MAG TPA: tetratricopeptide repeat protein [Clostridia bacterium]|nr:tetratricopeptide repeat protein [Clostridia bacterium]
MAENEIAVSAEVEQLLNDANRLIGNKAYNSAAALFEKALVLFPEYARLWERLGTCYMESGKVQQAEACFKQAAATNPNDFLTAFYWGVLNLDKRDWPTAEEKFKRATELHPVDTMAWFNLASARAQQKKREWRVAALQVLKIDPTFPLPESWQKSLKGSR